MKLINFWKTFSLVVIAFIFTLTTTVAPAFSVETSIGGKRTYHVTVQTGCELGAGTDGDIRINLTSDQGGTGFRDLNEPLENDFENCDNHQYTLTNLDDIGIPTQVTLKASSMNIVNDDWDVEEVIVEEGSNDQVTCPFHTTITHSHDEESADCS